MDVLVYLLGIAVDLAFCAGILLSIVKFVSENSGLASRFTWLGPIAPVLDQPRAKRVPYGKLILFAIAVRVLLFTAAALFCLIFKSEEAFNHDFFANMWLRWDGTHYLSIAEKGYSQIFNGDYLLLVFFPLYPWCIRLLHFVVSDYYVCGILLSWAFYVVGVVFLYKLLILDFKEKTVWRTLVLFSVFPFSFYFGSIHTESLTLMTMVITFYYIRKHNWPLVMVFGILSGLSRMVGSLVAVAAAIEYIRFYRPFHQLKQRQFGQFWRDILTKFIFIPLSCGGGLIYLGLNYSLTGNAFQFLEYQSKNWHHHTQSILLTVFDFVNKLAGPWDNLIACIWLPSLCILVVGIVLVIATWRKIPSLYSIFFMLYLSISYGVTWLISGCRYMSIAFPMFLMAAVWCEKKPSRYLACVIVSCLLLALYLAAFLDGKQVM